jgi:hypothetical protein
MRGRSRKVDGKKKLTDKEKKSIQFFLTNGYSGKHGMPSIYEDFLVCKFFGWNYEELQEQDVVIIEKFTELVFMEK